jgi:hypothetical protein
MKYMHGRTKWGMMTRAAFAGDGTGEESQA